MAAVIGPLSGVRVLDLSGSLGAYCTKLLADLGADVLKVEPPTGDPLRRRPPFKGDQPHPDGSLYFAYYHANKRGLVLDLTAETALEIMRRLAQSAAVAVISPYGGESGTGLDARWREWAPAEMVVCSVTHYGLTGPYRTYKATHLTSHAMGGLMIASGPPEGPPVVIPGQQMYDLAGTHAALSILVALRNQPVSGGQLIDVAAHEVMASQNNLIQRYAVAAAIERRGAYASPPPSGTWQVSDGLVQFQIWTAEHWTGFLDLIGRPEALTDTRFSDRLYRRASTQLIRDVVGPLLLKERRSELPDRAQALRVPCTAVNTPGDFSNDAQPRSRGFFVPAEHRYLGSYSTPGPPFQSSQPLWQQSRPAPMLGQHNREVLIEELGLNEVELGLVAEAGHV